ncbi:hypothetical protein [Pseudoalteromonas sp. S3776]|nr:hypothetical protein [Pseudoalteromonas sp. S3776]
MIGVLWQTLLVQHQQALINLDVLSQDLTPLTPQPETGLTLVLNDD